MKVTINKSKLRIYSGTLLFILSGHLYVLIGQTSERVLLLGSIPFFYKELKAIFQKSNAKTMDYTHHIFIACILADVVLYMTATPILYAAGMLYVWLLTIKIFPNISRKVGMKFYEWIFKVNLYFSTVVLIICFITEPVRLTNYSGVFWNSNGFGNYAAFVTALVFPLMIEKLNEKHKKNDFIILIVTLLLAIFSIVISSSRTAFLTLALESVFFIFLIFLSVFKKKLKKTYFKKIFYGSLLILFLIIVVLLYTDFIDILNNAIFNKFTHLSDNQLNGRSEYWEYIWRDSGLFEDGIKDIGAAHNVYFGLIDQFGKISGILYLLFIVCGFIRTFVFALNKEYSKWKFYPLFAGVAFLSVSMTESYLLTNAMLWFYIMLPMQEITKVDNEKVKNERVGYINLTMSK